MFHVGRYDPREEDRKKRKVSNATEKKDEVKKIKKQPTKRRKHSTSEKDTANQKLEKEHEQRHSAEQATTTLRVIAPETTTGSASTQQKLDAKLAEEAFDDLDLTEEIIDPRGHRDVVEDFETVEDDQHLPMDPDDELQAALYMSRKPIDEAAKHWELAPFLLENLKRDGYANFFPIQSLVIPDVIAAERHAHIQARDVCVAAPTGSGKTLAFVIPVLNALAGRRIRRLQALVILPSRDLGKAELTI